MRSFTAAFRKAVAGEEQLVIETADPSDRAFVGAHTHVGETARSLQLLNYRYDSEADRVLPIGGVTVKLRDASLTGARAIDLDGNPLPADVSTENGILTVVFPSLPLYAAIELF